MDNLKDIVSKNIIYLRTNNKMTQLELGERLNYSDKAVSKWERGEAIPDAYVLKGLSVLFEVSVDFLLTEHSKEELKATTNKKFGRRDIVSLISFLGTWTLSILIFIVLCLSDIFLWLVLVYTLPISLIVMIVLSAIWGRSRINFINISFLLWSLIASVYFTFWQHNWWLLFIIGVPSQAIVCLSFFLRKKILKEA